MFSQKSFSGDSLVDFVCLLPVLGVGFLASSALKTGLRIECFSRSAWESWMAPENKEMTGSMVKRPVWIRAK